MSQEITRFLFFDCIVFQSKLLKEQPYTKRLGYLRDNVMKPYETRFKGDPQYARTIPFRMGWKPVELSYGVKKVFQRMQRLMHKSDGIIFTSSVAPYSIGTCDKMLKWKPSEENTVDFKLAYRNDKSPFFMLQIWTGKEHVDFCRMKLEPELEVEWLANPRAIDKRIVECRYDPEWEGNWRFSRFRDDKENANHQSVYRSIMESIRDNVGADEVVSFVSRQNLTFMADRLLRGFQRYGRIGSAEIPLNWS
ncbi:Dcp1p-Dcp2p decapping enzyme complex alpha subunit [Irineochytrium annulatum]|nr:Dcp1p-Dcp2p decapping enzyme complex alpha subunit [Irineochytrium annulatum]